ncbi:MAG: NifU family protein [Bacteroidetes bacterium]|nr:MAG: NifU family protein [Bacteroidota bacterium]
MPTTLSDTAKREILERVERALDGIRPHLAADGGDVEVVDLTPEGLLKVRWLGNCQSCHMTAITMKAGIEQVILGKVPEVTAVEAVN